MVTLVITFFLSVASELLVFPGVTYNFRSNELQIEHAQHLAPGTAARFGAEEVLASVQVIFFIALNHLVICTLNVENWKSI